MIYMTEGSWFRRRGGGGEGGAEHNATNKQRSYVPAILATIKKSQRVHCDLTEWITEINKTIKYSFQKQWLGLEDTGVV